MSVEAIRTVLCAVGDSSHAVAVGLAGAALADHLGAQLVVARVDDRMAGTESEQAAAREAMSDFMLSGLPGGLGYRDGTDSSVLPGEGSG